MVRRYASMPLAVIIGGFCPGIIEPAHGQVLRDARDTHEWIGEPWGSPITVHYVDFQGRRCLRGIVTGATADGALVRTKRFLAENWQPPITAVRVPLFQRTWGKVAEAMATIVAPIGGRK